MENQMNFGDKTKKKEKEETTIYLEKTAHISFHVTGNGVDLIDWYGIVGDLALSDKFKITSFNVNIYYTEKK